MKKVCSVGLLITFFFAYQKGRSQENDFRFQHLSTQQGLSHNFISSIWQDQDGFMWFGTANGLNKYDGYNFTTFQFDPHEPNHTLQNNIVTDIREDRAGQLWVATLGGGLHHVDKKLGKMTCYSVPQGLSNLWNILFNIYVDTNGDLWLGSALGILRFNPVSKKFISYPMTRVNRVIGMDDRGRLLVQVKSHGELFSFDPKSGRFETKALHFPKNISFSDEKVWRRAASGRSFPLSFQFDKPVNPSAFLLDKTGTLWIGTSGSGLFRLNSKGDTDTLSRYNPKGLIHQTIYEDGLYEDAEGLIWVASPSGLQRIDQKFDQVINFQSNPEVPGSLSSNDVRCIYRDKTQNYWIGTDNGINKAISNPKPFLTIPAISFGSPIRAPEHNVQAILEDHMGTIWIGSLQKGLYQWLPDSGKLLHIAASPTERSGLASEGVGAIFEDSKGRLWVSTKEALHLFDRKSRKFIRYATEIPVLFMDEDAEGKLWVGGTVGLKGGIAQFDPTTQKFNYFIRDMTNVTADSVPTVGLNQFLLLDLAVSRGGDIWIATSKGINRLKPATGKFTYYVADSNSEGTLSDNWVRALYEDRNGTMWVGTHQGGLNWFDARTETFSCMSTRDGLSSNQVASISGDSRGNLWLATGYGISRYNPATRTFRNFDMRDGLPDNEYNIGSVHNRNDKIFFGSVNGAVAFHAGDIKDNNVVPSVHITSLKVLEKSRSIPEGDLQLQYDENFLSFDFVSLNYNVPEKNQYAYQLEGLDKDWIYSGGRRFANYTDLSPGSYTFRVKASNNDGIWNTSGTSLKIIIRPPWWRTSSAYVLYAISILCLLYIWRRHLIMRERLRNELRFERLASEKLQEVDALKSRFFTHISHEFRTPISLILGPLQEIRAGTLKGDQRPAIELMIRNGQRLLRLINQLLDLSKIEVGKMKLQACQTDLVSLLKDIAASYESLAANKKIKYVFITEFKELIAYVDQEKMEKVVHNLLSNAYKFTNANGEVVVSLQIVEKKWATIKVRDNGIGIPASQIDKIFDRFYQVDASPTRRYEGSGLGIALAKELVTLHYGKITVGSTEGVETEFTVWLPLGKDHLKPDQIIEEQKVEINKAFSHGLPTASEMEPENEKERALLGQHPVVLIVEDNDDMRQYIRKTLSDQYHIREAGNGKAGLTLAEEVVPDLIISDVMMPEMDGYQLCDSIKTKELTGHIPVILLTAKADRESKLTGLETGADDYLAKPFDADELRLIVRNRIESRNKMKDRFSREVTLEPQQIAITSFDEKFLKRVLDIIEAHMSDEKFSVDQLGREVGYSNMHLYRKIKALSGQTPSQFVKTIRLKRAAALLSNESDNVTQIAYKVGFNSVSYFNKCFKEQFGVTPGKFAETNQDKT